LLVFLQGTFLSCTSQYSSIFAFRVLKFKILKTHISVPLSFYLSWPSFYFSCRGWFENQFTEKLLIVRLMPIQRNVS
jgi:hypothetical protein